MKNLNLPHSLTHSLVIAFALLFLGGAFSSSCNSTPTPDEEFATLENPRFELPGQVRLDVRVQLFEPGKLPTSTKPAAQGLSETLRRAETKYVAVQLKKTLEQSNRWGTVRVVPAEHTGAELQVSGRIARSNGEELKLKVKVVDATGKKWFDKTFHSAVSQVQAAQAAEQQAEVFQSLYNQVANELTRHARKLTFDETLEIRNVAALRFAEELVPSTFGGYLKTTPGMFGKKTVRLERIPTLEDEFIGRIQRIQERDQMLVDTIDAHYENFHREMGPAYANWRQLRLAEITLTRAAKEKKAPQPANGTTVYMRGEGTGEISDKAEGVNQISASAGGSAMAAGTQQLLSADRARQESEASRAFLERLGVSFAAGAESISLQVEENTINLSGTVEAQYEKWRELLAVLYKVDAEGGILPEAGDE